jgi:hypothetical protein
MTSCTRITKHFSTLQSSHCEEIGHVCKCWTWSIELGQARVLSFGMFSGPVLIQWQWDEHWSPCEIVGLTRWDGPGTERVSGEELWAELDYYARIRSKPLWVASRKKCQVGYEQDALGRGLFFQNLSLFPKKHVDLNNSKHKNEIFPFFDMMDPKVSYNYILFNIFVQEPI